MAEDEEQTTDERDGENDADEAQPEIGAEEVLEEVRDLVREMAPKKKRKKDVRLDSELGSELGIDSLGRAELLQRLEDRFDVALPDRVVTEAESPRDLLREVRSAAPATERREMERQEVAEAAGEEAEEEAESACEAVEDAGTLLAVLDIWADRREDRRHILFLDTDTESGQVETRELTFGHLRRRSRDAARALQAMDLDPGDAVGLMLPSGLEYFVAFVGVLRAGGVPVPLYPPMRRSQIEDHLKRQAGILKTAQVKILVTFDQVKPLTRLVKARAPELEKVITPAELEETAAEEGEADGFLAPTVEADNTAFLQFTSGSTGDPKGVILTHRNLLSNLRSMGEILELDPDDDVIVSWLPLYHDMGLIGAWMGSLYFGVPLVLMSPLAFLSRPIRWLRAVHKYRGTVSAAPNFAYELCLKKLGDDELEGEDLDLSSWRLALNGAEPVSPRSVERFPERFGRFGFEAKAMMPVYGLAENSLAVTFSDPAEAPKIDAVDREAFQRDREAVPLEEENGKEEDGENDAGEDAKNEKEAALRFVSCGRPLPNHEVRFVDEDGHEVGERREGRLQFRGPSSTSGYFRNTEETERLIGDDGWLDSEDLGYEAEGEIYLTGRSKDVIVRAGRNVHPQDVEDAIGDLDGVRPGCVAVFAAEEDEHLVVVAETRIDEDEGEEREDLRDRIATVVRELTGTDPDDVALVAPRTVPKTSSGKIRRSAARELYEEGELGAARRAVWMQVARLALSGVFPALRRLRRRAAGWLYAARFWLVSVLVAVPAWLAVAILPRRPWRRRWVRRSARLLARLTGTRLDVRGEEHLPSWRGGAGEDGEPRIFAANHSSYLDAFVLAAVLPPNCAYVAKAEFRRSRIARVFLERLGAVFVERFDPRKGEEGSEKARQALERGDHLVIFPEGTFRRASGLLPFRMGAFVVAAGTGTPVVPVVLRGTRSKLRGESFFPRAGNVVVTGRPPEKPAGEDWDDAVDLRDRVRESMLDRVAEPDLA